MTGGRRDTEVPGDVLRLDPKPASDVLYERGSIVVCYHCGKPLYKLQASIYVGEPMGKTAWKYAPIAVKDVIALLERNDLEAGQIAALKVPSLQDWQTHCEGIKELKAGDYADCPACKASFMFSQTRTGQDGAASFGDRGYLVFVATIPPVGKARRISA